MATEMISLKLEKKFLKQIDSVVKSSNYHSRTEFIRESLRHSIEKENMKKALLKVTSLKGRSKRSISHDEFERIKDKAFGMLD